MSPCATMDTPTTFTMATCTISTAITSTITKSPLAEVTRTAAHRSTIAALIRPAMFTVPNCGHEKIPHGDHIDYLVTGHLHHPHDGHCDDHGKIELAA